MKFFLFLLIVILIIASISGGSFFTALWMTLGVMVGISMFPIILIASVIGGLWAFFYFTDRR